MKKYIKDLDRLKDINLLPATGADQAEQLISTMISYDMDFQLLLNHNNDGWKFGQQLKEKFGFGDEKITFVSEKLGFFTEDLFTFKDFKAHIINGGADEEQATLNSIYLKNNSMNKVMLAKSFYEKTEQQKDRITFSDDTITAFKNVFEKILEQFHAETKDVEEIIVPKSDSEKKKEPSKGGVKRRSLFAFLNKK